MDMTKKSSANGLMRVLTNSILFDLIKERARIKTVTLPNNIITLAAHIYSVEAITGMRMTAKNMRIRKA